MDWIKIVNSKDETELLNLAGHSNIKPDPGNPTEQTLFTSTSGVETIVKTPFAVVYAKLHPVLLDTDMSGNPV